jgi:D-glycero-beta-D-manno-heptose-7-phosphate kinase
MDFNQLFSSFSGKKVAVIGDAMLDSYWWGSVERISPEAPVPIVTVNNKELRIGGAGNVALNTVALGATTYMLTVLGNDADGQTLLQLLQQQGVDTQYCIQSSSRVTTNKTRIISRNQQMMRLDAEMTTDIDKALEQALLQQFAACIQQQSIDVLIFEDYNKGVLTPHLIKSLIHMCKEAGILTAVDPKKNNFLAYQSVDLFKPNLKEVKEGLQVHIPTVTAANMQKVHEALHQHLQHQISFITLSEHGVYYQTPTNACLIPCHVRNIADVSGAGDTVIAVASLVYATTHDMQLAAEVANIAGGLVCEEVGTAAINATKLLAECSLLLGSH